MKKINIYLSLAIIVMVSVCAMTVNTFAATAIKTLAGVEIAASDDSGKINGDSSVLVLEVSVKGGLFSPSSSSSYFTFTWPSTQTATCKVSFQYTYNGKGESHSCSWTTNVNTYNTYEAKLKPGDSFSVVLGATASAGFGEANSTLTITNFKVEEIKETTVMFSLDETRGSMTAGGASKNNGGSITLTDSAKFVATAKTGYTFVAWVNADTDEVVSRNASFDYAPTGGSVTLKPVFASTEPWFYVENSTKLVQGFDTAMTHSGVVALANNATLPTGNYTIPAGVTLLIPYGESTSAYTDPLSSPDIKAFDPATPYLFRKLTVESGTTICCEGNIRVDAMQCGTSWNYTGVVSGAYGQIELQEDVVLEMYSGSSLRAYGYITGAGTVNCSGATVYELFQIADWRGGTNTSLLYLTLKDESFFVSQFYIQNIEAKLVLNYQSKLNACAVIGYNSTETIESITTVFGSDGLFQMTNGCTSRVVNSNGRVNYVVDGNLTLGSVSINFSLNGILNQCINSSDYVLTFPANMTVTVNSGTANLDGSFKLQPGAKWVVSKGATLNLNSNAELIIYDYATWDSGTYTLEGKYYPVYYSPTNSWMSRSTEPGQLVVDGTLNINSSAGVYITMQQATAAPLLTGTGVVKVDSSADWIGRTTIKEVTGNTTDTTKIEVTPIQAFLCSDSSTFTKMAAGTTYTGDGKVWHILYEDGSYCTVCNYVMKFYTNMVFGNDLKVKFAFPKTAISDTTGCYVVIDRSYSDGRNNDTKTIQADAWSESGSYHVVVYDGVAAKEMCDKICVTVYNSSGVALSVTWEDSIREYAMRVLENSKDNEITRTAYVDMLNYGAAAQTYFAYGTNDLANAKLSEEQKAWASSERTYTNAASLGDKHVGSQLVFKSNIAFRVAFRGLDTGMTASVSYTNHYGNPIAATGIQITESNKSGSYYYVIIPDLVVADARQLITVTIYNADGTEFTTCTESIESYLARATKSSELNMAFIKFADSAHAYLHRNDNTEET